MRQLLIAIGFLFCNALYAQATNDTTYWQVSKAGDTATYYLKQKPETGTLTVTIKKDNSARVHNLQLNNAPIRATALLYTKKGAAKAGKEHPLQTIELYVYEDPFPVFDISSLKSGSYVIQLVGSNINSSIALNVK